MAISFEERVRRAVIAPAALAILSSLACGDSSNGSNWMPGDDAGSSGSSGGSGSSSTSGSGSSSGSSGTGSSSGNQPGDAASGDDASGGSSGASADGGGSSGAGGDGGCAPAGQGGGGQPAIAPLPNGATQYQGTFTSPPTQTSTGGTTDAPLLGNGDVGVAVFGTIDAMTFILGKTEFWSLAQLSIKAMSRLSLSIPGMSGASYAMTEDIGTGQVTGTFSANGNTVATTSWVQATDTTNNLFFTKFAYTGGGTQTVTVSLAVGNKNTNPTSQGAMADVLYQDVQGDSGDTVGGDKTHKVRVATRAVGATGTVANDNLTFTLTPGQTITLATSIMSNFDADAYQTQAVANVSSLMPSDVDTFNAKHQAWWDAFYRTSYVTVPDKIIEKEYWASLYILASTSRTGEIAPGLWGPWVMQDPSWGYYTMDYNQEVPFYAAFPTNHVELADCYDPPIIAYTLSNAEAQATAAGFTGALFSIGVGISPHGQFGGGLGSTGNLKSIGAWSATDMIMHYYYRPDPAYAQSIYPALKQMALFWENYLVKNGSTYDIVNDAQQEGDMYPQTDGIMSLGLVRFLLQGCIDISTALNMDATERAIWQDRLTNLSPFPTFTGCPSCTNGETVFRWTSLGRDWAGGNAIGIQHIYPGSQIGLSSDPTLLQTAKNMVGAMARWNDGNGTVTFYPAAARVGYDPATILKQLDSWIQGNTYPNLHIHSNGGGIENVNTVPSTLAEMMLQSFQGTLRLFPNWPSGTDAKFANLRAYGGYLVASQMRMGTVPYVAVTSEMGNAFTLSNPWGSGQVAVYRNGTSAPAMSGSTLTIQTCPGEIVVLAPSGTSYASVVALMNAQ
jgi:hypothetical protein